MQEIFGINFEFNQFDFEKIIFSKSISSSGYCCFVDSNLLVESYKNNQIKNILNNSLVNSCDGNYIALFASLIYNKKFKAFNGPTFFNKLIFCNEKMKIFYKYSEIYPIKI